jgi:HAD superfamily phosphatase (TIGR01668 family)
MPFLERFYPDEWLPSAYAVDYQKLYDKGYRGLIYDIDNTLVEHGAPADQRALQLFAQLRAIGFSTCLLSNNRKHRVATFASAVGSDYIYLANKPAVKNYLRACEQMGIQKEQAVFIGDQLFTDVWGAKRAGITNILVQPLNPKEEIQIVLKRRLEWIVLRSFEKEMRKKGRTEFPSGKFQTDGRM